MDSAPPFLTHAPPLHPDWIAHESQLPPAPAPVDVVTHKRNYILACRTRNAHLVATRDIHLTTNISIADHQFTVPSSSHPQIYRKYTPANLQHDISVVYYHGGGLYVGDLDSEDLTCRRICIALGVVVYSCEYRTMPEVTPDECLEDALALFQHLSAEKKGPFVIGGSSSGGQLAAQVSQAWLREQRDASNKQAGSRVNETDVRGVLLRCPVTCNPSNLGSLPLKYRTLHASLTEPSFRNLLVMNTCVDDLHRTKAKMPLEEEALQGMPRHWVQLCTNDLFYSDGACYVDALHERGVIVKTDFVEGWPHTFWLKHPELNRAVKAESDMLDGLKWLIEGE